MVQKTKHRLAWLALFLTVIVILLAQGCSMFEDQMNTMKGLVGMGDDPVVVETPVCDLSCVDEVKG